ncbi:MAG: hypothetical protein QW579_03060 [Desulfurococcaceae archaeon]
MKRFKSYVEEIREDATVKILYSKGVKCSLTDSTRLKIIVYKPIIKHSQVENLEKIVSRDIAVDNAYEFAS